MSSWSPKAARENGPELQEVFARLRAVGGGTLAEGQTACCYALSRNSVLLRALEALLKIPDRG